MKIGANNGSHGRYTRRVRPGQPFAAGHKAYSPGTLRSPAAATSRHLTSPSRCLPPPMLPGNCHFPPKKSPKEIASYLQAVSPRRSAPWSTFRILGSEKIWPSKKLATIKCEYARDASFNKCICSKMSKGSTRKSLFRVDTSPEKEPNKENTSQRFKIDPRVATGLD